MIKDIEKIFVDILKTELGLPTFYEADIPSVVIGSQNFMLGKVDDLQIMVQNTNSKVIYNNNYLNVEAETETQSVVMIEDIQIDLFSKNTDARTRRWEIIAALQSYYSLEQQEKYQFKIYKIPSSFTNTTEAEGGSQINRFTIIIPCTVWYNKEKVFEEYYDAFPTRVDSEASIGEDTGEIEFTLEEEE